MLFMLFIGIISFLVAVIAVQNSMAVTLSFFTLTFDSNLIVVIIVSLLAGMLIAACRGLKLKTQGAWRQKKLKDQLKRLEEENKTLKGTIMALKHEQKTKVPPCKPSDVSEKEAQ